jgi:hypothetical protein
VQFSQGLSADLGVLGNDVICCQRTSESHPEGDTAEFVRSFYSVPSTLK